jgi:hypothetical protein
MKGECSLTFYKLCEPGFMKTKIQVFGVKWDTEEKNVLPAKVVLDVPDTIDLEDSEEVGLFIENALSDSYGFTHFGWESEQVL